MAKKVIKSVTVSSDVRDQLNANFTELYSNLGVVGVTADAAEINKLDGLGTTKAELAMINGATFTASDLNKLAAVTAAASDLSTLQGVVNNVTLTATPASGTCGVQFVFKSALGNPIGFATSGTMYFATTNTGLIRKTVTSAAVLTNGVLEALVATKLYNYTTTAAGLLGVTITAAAGDYYPVFVMPNGSIKVGTVCTVS